MMRAQRMCRWRQSAKNSRSTRRACSARQSVQVQFQPGSMRPRWSSAARALHAGAGEEQVVVGLDLALGQQRKVVRLVLGRAAGGDRRRSLAIGLHMLRPQRLGVAHGGTKYF
jgi:hypothetical protein